MKCKYTIIIVLLVIPCLFIYGASPDHFELQLGFAPGFPSGTLSDDIENSLAPKPSTQETSLLIHGTWFFHTNIGIDCIVRFGTIQAVSKNYSKPLSVINDQSVFLGPIFRGIVNIDMESSFIYSISGGGALHSMQWNSDYSSMLPSGVVLASITPGPGYYGKVALQVRYSNLIAGLSVIYEAVPAKLSNSNDFSSTCWSVPLEIGYCF